MRKRIVCLPVLAAASCLLAQDQPQPKEAAPQPAGEQSFSGNIEFGYRFIPNVSGSFNTYRSVVNLGEGPKLFGADAAILDPRHRLFDRLDLHLTSLGDDPYETARLAVSKRKLYRLTVDWRNIAYFNYLPSFANVFRSVGSQLDANSFDTRMRNTDVRLDILPGSRFVPYLAYGSNSQNGRGITSFVDSQIEYAVATAYHDQTGSYRGGVDINIGRWHANVEEGGTTFKDDQGASNNVSNTGDRTAPFLGQQLLLNGLGELYRVRGNSTFTKASFGASLTSWATISGQFVYAKPAVDLHYNENATGNFYLTSLAQFVNTGSSSIFSTATLPHPSGSFNIELRPWKRVRIVDFWMTDRLHDDSSILALSSSAAFAPGAPSLINESYNQQELDLFFDVTSRLTVRVGDRYVWGDASQTAPLIVRSTYESGHLSQNVGIGGLSYRAAPKTRVNVDYEVSESNQAWFRTSLRNYKKFHARGSHDLTPSLRFAVDYSLLSNSNADPAINYDFSSHAASLSLNWLPRGGKWMTALLDYTRSNVQSSIFYLVPITRASDTSLYHENAHTGTALIGVKWFSAGGSFYVSSGSRPVRYYQPLARVSVPVHKHVALNAEWRYYGFAEQFYQFEGFRGNQLMTSLRLLR